MNQNNKGYYVYSIFAVIAGFCLFGFLGYLIHDIIIQISTNKFSNLTIVQTIATSIATVLLGGYMTKKWEFNNNIRLEKFKSQKEIAIHIIDLMGIILGKNDINRELAVSSLINENYKVKLLFDDDLVLLINSFIQSANKETYSEIVESLKKYFVNISTKNK